MLTYLGQHGRERRFGVVIDEFSYFVDQAPGLPSLLQRWWDQTGARSQIKLVLASSHVGYMNRLLQGDQPLFGRRTGELRLQPFDYADAARFFPGYDPIDRLRSYGVFGGMPAYLAACEPDLTLAENIRRRILEPDAYLRSEPLYLLAQERTVTQPASYLSILRAIAEGQTQPNLIAQSAGFRSPADIAPHLQRLQEFRLVERHLPVTAETNSRLGRYVIADPFLAFWFRFIQPAEALLDRGLTDPVLSDILEGAEGLNRFFSRAQGGWERACGDYLWRALRAGSLGGTQFDRFGPWWESRGAADSAEIDQVGLLRGRVTLVASCKWRNEWAKPGDLHELRRVATRLKVGDDTCYVILSRSGFDPALVAVAATESVTLVDPQQMFMPEIVDFSSSG